MLGRQEERKRSTITQLTKRSCWVSPSVSKPNRGGDMGVGKTSLALRLHRDEFINVYGRRTTATQLHRAWDWDDSWRITIHLGRELVRLDVMDLNNADVLYVEYFIRWQDAFVVVYSVAQPSSLDMAKTYLERIMQLKYAVLSSFLKLKENLTTSLVCLYCCWETKPI